MIGACQLDHLVVTAPDLSSGVSWVGSVLGVAPQAGGEHVRMGTHNALLRLGESIYLEVIAPNPAVPPPARPRWFELDDLERNGSPRLVTWMARTEDVRSAVKRCGNRFGPVEEMSRGGFRWLITIPPDGGLIAGGLVPMLIQWEVDGHPAFGLPDVGCRLLQMQLFSRESSSLAKSLDCLGLRPAVEVRQLPAGVPPYLVAEIDTPLGPRSLRGRS